MTSNNGQWTRDDLPSVMDLVKASVDATAIDPSGGADAALDAVVAHLNAHHPKPGRGHELVIGGKLTAPESQYKRERDDLRRQVDDLKERRRKHATEREAWTRNRRELESERDAAVARAEAHAKGATRANLDRDKAYEELTAMTIRAEAAERDRDYARARLREVCSTPAVHVVRESDLPAARVDGDDYLVEDPKGDYRWPKHGASWWEDRAQDALTKAARFTALARLAASEAVVDPVEAKARAEADRRYSGDPNHAFIEGAVWATRHLNEQEAGDE